MITVTDSAVQKLKDLLVKNNKVGEGIRIGVKGGGCSGLTYYVNFEREKREGDELLQFDGLTLYVDKKSLLFLQGTSVDWQESLTSAGFTFQNPNATGTCGCGTSFSV